MSNVIDFILTNAASELISKVLSGKTLNFTRMAVGDGFSYDTTVAKGFTTIVNEVLSLDITKKETLSPSSIKFTSAFKNTDAEKEFYYREVGLYAQDPDTGEEVLYAYGNRNEAAELITPAGSNIITKQLIFVITVGDSANVTFNVNADIYALQEDMLDVQENKANKNLSNTGMITNCLLEVPQKIKFDLTNGVFTLKAGTKLYVPNGFEDDGTTKKFETHIVPNDIIFAASTENKTYVTGVSKTGSTYRTIAENVYSQITEPTNPADLSIWYDITNNVIKRFANNAWTEYLHCLPIGITTWANGLCTSINQVFNGYGFIGSTIFELPGVKGLITEGINDDGSLKTVLKTTTKVAIDSLVGVCSNSVISSFNGDIEDTVWLGEFDEHPSIEGILATPRYLNTKTNFMLLDARVTGNWQIQYGYMNVFEDLKVDTTGKIISITPKKPFRAVDYNDYQTKITDLESRLSLLETNLSS